MNKSNIKTIQDFLTIDKGDDTQKYQIINIQLLLYRHPPAAVIRFLTDLHQEYSKKLRRVIREDKTSAKLDELIAAKFRVKMAINAIRNYANEGGRAS
jgi:hypothetical protein